MRSSLFSFDFVSIVSIDLEDWHKKNILGFMSENVLPNTLF